MRRSVQVVDDFVLRRLLINPYPPETAQHLRKELSLQDLVLFNLAAIISTRWIGVAAHVGPATIVLWLLAALLSASSASAILQFVACSFPVSPLFSLFCLPPTFIPSLCFSQDGVSYTTG